MTTASSALTGGAREGQGVTRLKDWVLARMGQALVTRVRATRTGRFTFGLEIVEVLDFEIIDINPPGGKERRKNSPVVRSWYLPMCPPC